MKKPHCGVQLSPQLFDYYAIAVPKLRFQFQIYRKYTKRVRVPPKQNISKSISEREAQKTARYKRNLCRDKKIVFAGNEKIFYLRSSKQEKLTLKQK